MFVPVEAGLVIVRDAEAMRIAFSLVPPYLRTDGSTSGVGGSALVQRVRLSADARIPRAEGLDDDEAVRAARATRRRSKTISRWRDISPIASRAAPDLELMAPPGLSVVCFRFCR